MGKALPPLASWRGGVGSRVVAASYFGGISVIGPGGEFTGVLGVFGGTGTVGVFGADGAPPAGTTGPGVPPGAPLGAEVFASWAVFSMWLPTTDAAFLKNVAESSPTFLVSTSVWIWRLPSVFLVKLSLYQPMYQPTPAPATTASPMRAS